MSELLKSNMCTYRQLTGPKFARWWSRLGTHPHLHRKVWEFLFICEALDERGVLTPGARGLGFAVGQEPLAACFANLGCLIVATDLHPDAVAASEWAATSQHARSINLLNPNNLCPPEVFRDRVTLRYVDMNHIPDDLQDFDFCWSSCSIEHLGSIEHGMRFMNNMTRCLRPGGVAVHTTEYNVFSDGNTLDNCGAVIFRKRDVEAMAAALPRYGARMVERDYDWGDHPIDFLVDRLPYLHTPHLKLELGGFTATSFGLIVEKL
jgi:SAM-dependent methyltransferase